MSGLSAASVAELDDEALDEGYRAFEEKFGKLPEETVTTSKEEVLRLLGELDEVYAEREASLAAEAGGDDDGMGVEAGAGDTTQGISSAASAASDASAAHLLTDFAAKEALTFGLVKHEQKTRRRRAGRRQVAQRDIVDEFVNGTEIKRRTMQYWEVRTASIVLFSCRGGDWTAACHPRVVHLRLPSAYNALFSCGLLHVPLLSTLPPPAPSACPLCLARAHAWLDLFAGAC